MYAISFSDHWADLLVAAIVLEMAVLGTKNGLFRGVVLGLQSIASIVLALALSARVTMSLQAFGISSTTGLGVAFLTILAAAAIGTQIASQRLIAGRDVKLPSVIDKIGGGLAGGMAGFSFAGALLIALSMLPMPNFMRMSTDRMTLDAGSKMLQTFARCLTIERQSRDRLLENYRLAAWHRSNNATVDNTLADDPTPAPVPALNSVAPDGPLRPSKKGLAHLDFWSIESGMWEVTNEGRIRGIGDSRLRLKSPTPWKSFVSLKMRVQRGWRPAVLLAASETDVIWLGNTAFSNSLSLHGPMTKQAATPQRYDFGKTYNVCLQMDGDQAILSIDSKQIATATVVNPPDEYWLTLSAGNTLSPGEAEFWDFTILPPRPSVGEPLSTQPSPAAPASVVHQ